MYPDLQYLTEAIFGTTMPGWLSVFKTFGLFVAISFLAGSYFLKSELKRKESQGLLKSLTIKKIRKENNEVIFETVFPHQQVGTIVVLALIGGLIGAKVFNALETWDDFLSDPWGNLFSGGGLTFYGGLIFAGVIIVYYTKKNKIDLRQFLDAISPCLMLAYGVGRFGCHLSGDGDWGIMNSAYTSLPDGSLKPGSINDFEQAIMSSGYFSHSASIATSTKNLYIPVPQWLPDWTLASNFRHNVINEGEMISGCTGNHCSVLPVSVFPTSLYEGIICILLFIILWRLRKRFKVPLHLFGLYLLLNGLERFLIEKIKVNYRYDWGYIHPTQSEIISVVLIMLGCFTFLWTAKTKKRLAEDS